MHVISLRVMTNPISARAAGFGGVYEKILGNISKGNYYPIIIFLLNVLSVKNK